MNETEIGEYARSKGLFVEQINNRCLICSHAFDTFSKECKNAKAILKDKDDKIKVLEADIDMKNKALAEMAVHFVLAKNLRDLGGPKGRVISSSHRLHIIELIDDCISNGGKYETACPIVGIDKFTFYRCKQQIEKTCSTVD